MAVSKALVRQAYEETSEAHWRTKEAEREKARQLGVAKMNEATALRLADRPGRRYESLERLHEAVHIFRSLDLLDQNRLSLRNDAIAAMALQSDLRLYRRTRREAFLILSRIQNFGYEMGENGRTPEWYRASHRTPWVASALDRAESWSVT